MPRSFLQGSQKEDEEKLTLRVFRTCEIFIVVSSVFVSPFFIYTDKGEDSERGRNNDWTSMCCFVALERQYTDWDTGKTRAREIKSQEKIECVRTVVR